ncbi:MAG: signal recognition particle-docking protein FtsY [Burkholderiaceae bacterium]|nr:signal recognition particle-docking protein FtsY [Burkholderiaceae bacterium]
MLYPAEVLQPAAPEPQPSGPEPKPAAPEPQPPAPEPQPPAPAPQPAAPEPKPAAPEPESPPAEAAEAAAPEPENRTESAEAAAAALSAGEPSGEAAAEPVHEAAAEAPAEPAPTAFYGSLYTADVLARPEAIVLPSGDAIVTLTQAERNTWVKRLREGMSRTRGNLAGLFSNVQVDDALFDELETALIASDAGVATTQWLMQRLQERVRRERLAGAEQVRLALRALIVDLLMPLEKPMDIDAAEPLVMMIAGVNGAGKTTSIGKLAHHLQREGKSILLAAGDTFRAAAREQLAEWGSRNRVDVIAQQGGDPAAVAFDAVHAGRARRTGIVIIDTAGRLPTQTHLMEELRKIRRVVAKAMEGAPHETLLVLDGNTGQNMLAQVKAFDEAVPLSGLIVTKLDGTAKGGALAALAFTRRERPIPVYFIGVGEKIDDLQAFSAEEFAGALLD